MKKRFLAMALCLLVLLAVLPKNSRAAGFLDTERAVSLTVSARKGDVKLSGAEFHIYLVAAVDAYGEITVTENFSRFNLDIRGKNDEAWQEMTLLLESYIAIDDIKPTDSGATDQNGILTFPTGEKPLAQGIYLVVGQVHRQEGVIYTPASFLVSLPGRDKTGSEWIYDVSVVPKYESRDEEETTITRKVLKIWDDEGYEDRRPEEITVYLLKDGTIVDTVQLNDDNGWAHTWEGLAPDAKYAVAENAMKDYAVEITREGITFVITNRHADETPPPTTTPDKPPLPQTGQLWWPVPALFALGLAMIVVGLARRRGYDYEK